MIPLSYFLLAWFALIAIFAIMTFITVVMNIKFGLSGFVTYFTTSVFLGVVFLVLLGTGGYLLTVDWSQSLNLYSAPGTDIYDL